MKDILKKLGFSEYKQQAYVALVKIEKGTVGEIARKANIPSSKIYETLRWLYQNGYITIVKEKPLTYKANDPRSILRSDVKSKIEELHGVYRDINKIKTPLDTAEKGTLQVVSGKEASYKKIKEAASKSSSTIVAVVKDWKMDYEMVEINKQFTKRKGRMRFLGPITEANEDVVKEWKKTGALVKSFDSESTRFSVWDKKIVTIRFEDKEQYLSLWIENEYLAKVLTQHFDNIWRKTSE